MGLEASGSTTRVSSLSWHSWLNSALGLSLRYQSSNAPDVGHSGAAVWFCAFTLSLVKWKAGNTTTGVSGWVGAGTAMSLKVREPAAESCAIAELPPRIK